MQFSLVFNNLRVQGHTELDFMLMTLQGANLLVTEWVGQLVIFRREFLRIEDELAQLVNHISNLVNEVASSIDESVLFVVQSSLFLNQQEFSVFIGFEVTRNLIVLKGWYFHYSFLGEAFTFIEFIRGVRGVNIRLRVIVEAVCSNIIDAQHLQHIRLHAPIHRFQVPAQLIDSFMVHIVKLVAHLVNIMQVVHAAHELSIEKHFLTPG
jgi:hypothetical protein